jgi:hypothetical protein
MTVSGGGEGSGKRLDPKVWADIRLCFEGGERVDDLAEDYDVNRATIYERARREGWLRPEALANEAIGEARQEFKSALKERWREIAERENENHWKINAYMQQLGMSMAKRIAKAMATLPEDAPPGNLAYQMNVVQGAVRSAMEFNRQVLKIGDQSLLDASDSQGTVGRLLEIREAGRRAYEVEMMEEGGDAAQSASEEAQEAVHPDSEAGL